jgi:hypothetical protein
MPIVVLVASTLVFWVIYWFVRMGGVDHFIADADRLAEPLSVSEMQGLPSHREGEKFFEHVAGAGRIKGGHSHDDLL